MTKRYFSGPRLEESMELSGVQDLTRWNLQTPRPSSDTLLINLKRYESFSLTSSEAAKVMLIDTILAEVISDYPTLKVWKEEPLESGSVGGVVDYLAAPRLCQNSASMHYRSESGKPPQAVYPTR